MTRRSPTQRSSITSPIFLRKETADAWYNRPESELLPEGFKCPKCNGADFRKETDILDVWFDSGSSCVAVLETRDNLYFPADVYLEGGDQFRGWFNSSLMCGLAAHDRAPYKQVVTYGWVVDGEGKPMHKSGGNAVSPNDFMKRKRCRCDAALGGGGRYVKGRSLVERDPRTRDGRLSQVSQHAAICSRKSRGF